MKSKITVASLFEDLKAKASNWKGLQSLTCHGSQAAGYELLFYTDLDVIFVFDDQSLSAGLRCVNQYFNNLCSEQSTGTINFIYRIESGPMHPFRERDGQDPIIPLRKRRIVFFHVSVFSEGFYKGVNNIGPGLSPMLIYSWQNYEPLIGSPLRALRSLDHISIKDVLEAGLGILDGTKMLQERETHFWRWVPEANGQYRMFWDSAPF